MSVNIGIDICQFNTDQEAKKSCEIMSKNTYLYDRIVNLNDLNSLRLILHQWKEKWKYGIPNKSFSVVGIRGKKVVHIYNFNEKGVDINFIHLLFEKLSSQM